MVGYTHFQHAQPISVAFWLSHYAAILLRDGTRLKSAYDVTDENPLGAGAISGTSFPIDRQLTTKLLGFQKVLIFFKTLIYILRFILMHSMQLLLGISCGKPSLLQQPSVEH
jgi:argininosuccinate lyase